MHSTTESASIPGKEATTLIRRLILHINWLPSLWCKLKFGYSSVGTLIALDYMEFVRWLDFDNNNERK